MRSTLLASAALLLGLASTAQAGEIRLCTGDTGGVYQRVGDIIAGFSTNTTTVAQIIDTGGTWGNIHRTVELPATDPKACDAFIGQPDGAALLKAQKPQLAAKLRKIGTLHREYLHVLCNKLSGNEELDDLEDREDVSVDLGPDGSGAWLIWQNFIAHDAGYDKPQVRNEGGIQAISSVAAGLTTCMLRPAGLHDGVVTEADEIFGQDLVLATANDKDFIDAQDIDGTRLYAFQDIPDETYPQNLQASWGDTSVETVTWLASVYVNIDRVKGDDFSSLIRIVGNAAKQARAQFGQ